MGLRGPEISLGQNNKRRILFLGSSATLGWGVEEKDTMTSQLERLFAQGDEKVTVMNSGIGNYNATRYVELFLTKLIQIQPTDIVVNYYVNDAEILDAGGGNILLRNSQLAVTAWILFNRLFRASGEDTLLEHYRRLYESERPGFIAMKNALNRLALQAREKGIRLFLMMMPEVHQYKNYKYGFVHAKMKKLANSMGYTYVDALPFFTAIPDSRRLWAMPGDPHPNALAHRLFAEGLYPVLRAAGN